jgi:4-amino-4-deoxy-L-arabinose transferase-like glycosyltransferase
MLKKLKLLFSQPFNIALAGILLFHALFNIVWQRLNTAPPTWDGAGHLSLAFTYADKIVSFFKFNGDASLLDLIRVSTYYPPLLHFLGGIVFLVFGRNYEHALLLETVFLLLAIVFLYKIIRYKFPDKPALALVSSLIFSLLPGLWGESRQFHLDVPLTAMLLVSYYFLIKSDSLKSRKYSLLFFVAFALTQLTKWYGFVYLAVPFIYEVLIKAKQAKELLNKARIYNILYGSAIVLLVALPWYFFNLQTILANVKVASTADAGDPTNIWSLDSLLFYLHWMVTHQLGILCVLLIALSVHAQYIKRILFRNYLLYMFLLPYLIFSFIQNKDIRYVLPVTPILAFYITYYLLDDASKIYRVIKASLLVAFLLFYYFLFSFNQFTKLPNNLVGISYVFAGPGNLDWVYEPNYYAYDDHDWNTEQIVHKVESIADAEELSVSHYKVLEASDNKFYAIADFDMYKQQSRYYNMDLTVPFFKFDTFTPDELSNYVRQMDFAIVPDSAGPPGLRNIIVLNQLIAYFKNDQNMDFIEMAVYTEPDGNVIHVYKRAVSYMPLSNLGINPASVKLSASSILLLDKKNLPDEAFKVYTYSDSSGTAQLSSVDMPAGNGAEKRISLTGVNAFKVDLAPENIDVQYLYGWSYDPASNLFIRDQSFWSKFNGENQASIYSDFSIKTKSASFINPITTISRTQDGNVRITLNNLSQSVAVDYGLAGWKWSRVMLTAQNPSLTLHEKDLWQFNVTSPFQLISNLGSDWGYFPCYKGNAVCFYPIVNGL